MDVSGNQATEKPTEEQAATRHRVTVLGAGPAGAATALVLARDNHADVTVLEQRGYAGGNAASFQLAGVWCDYGSHRLHPAAEPRVMDEVKGLLGDDLLLRPRHGRIRLQKRWIHFPLKPVDLVLRLPKRFVFSLLTDSVRKLMPRRSGGEENFSTVLEQGLGRTICESFYFPYVQKLWGREPRELSVTLARRRVSGSSIGKMVKKVLAQLPMVKTEMTGVFFYPRRGYGAITERLAESAVEAGADLVFEASVTAVHRDGERVVGVSYQKDGQTFDIDTPRLWSTLPITLLARMMSPPAPEHVLEAASRIEFRGMILIYIVLEQQQFTEYDAHYFPELDVPLSRLSEPKNYTGSTEPRGRTVLCAELPSDPGDEYWELSDDELGARLCEWLGKVGLPVNARVLESHTRRLRFAYPVYNRDYENHLQVVDEWLDGIEGLLTLGRQGLFAHDNTHHAMVMAYAANDCLRPDGSFDKEKWHRHRVEFESHVVED